MRISSRKRLSVICLLVLIACFAPIIGAQQPCYIFIKCSNGQFAFCACVEGTCYTDCQCYSSSGCVYSRGVDTCTNQVVYCMQCRPT